MSFTWRKNSPKIIKKWIEKCLNLTFYCIFSVVLLWFLQFYFLHLHTFVYEQIEDAFWHCHGDCTPVYDTRVCPCALRSRWILHTWKNICCIWSSRTRVKFIIWTSCGATTRRIVTLAKLPAYWPASPTCTGSDTAVQCQRHNMRWHLHGKLATSNTDSFSKCIRYIQLIKKQFRKSTLMFALWSCSTEISLKQRLEYIARAILSAKSSSSISAQASDGEFLHELEEKMEVTLTL